MASSDKCCGAFWGTDICWCHKLADHLLSSATGLVLSRVQTLPASQHVDNEDVLVCNTSILYFIEQKVLL